MTGKYRLKRSFQKFDQNVVREVIEYPGVLGVLKGGQYLVEVPNRPGYYYVRLLNNLSELIVAFNNGKISPVYDLPVLVTRNSIDKNRWYIAGRDAGRYGNWGSTAYLANHGAQHSFDPFTPGNDPVWVWGNQFMPMNTVPSGSNGSLNVIIEPSYYYINGTRKYVGLTGSPDLSAYKPTTSGMSRFVLLYADANGNVDVIVGSDFSHVISGTYGVNPYIPGMGTTTGVPMRAIRLETGTSYISWASMYDVRPFFDNGGGGSGAGSASGSIVGYVPERLVFTNVSGTMTTDKLMAYDQRIGNDPYRNSAVIGANTITADMQQFSFVVVDNYGENVNSGSGSYNYPMGVFTYADTPVFDWYYAEGTQANPNSVGIDTGLLYLQVYAYNSGTSSNLYLGGMDVFTAEDIKSTARGIRYEFRGSSTGTNSPNTVMLGMSANYAQFNGLVQVPATNAYYWGDYNVTGSWRQKLSEDSMLWQKNINGSWVTITSMSPGTYTSGSATDAFTVKVSSADTTADFLYNKISGSFGITTSKANSGGNESLVIASGREVLVADRTYYVRTDGSDSNNGLTNTAGGAFLTIQKAADVVGVLDINGNTVTIQVGAGTYTSGVALPMVVGQTASGQLKLVGNSASPSSVVISTTGANCITAPPLKSCVWSVEGFKLVTATSGGCILASGGRITFSRMEFGSCVNNQVAADSGGIISATGSYSISGGAQTHISCQGQAFVNVRGCLVLITGSVPNYTTAYCYDAYLGDVWSHTAIYSGSATGVRYNVSANSVLLVAGVTLPGNSAGTTATGGQVI